jgi:iron complex outermembrane recepter protein
VKGANRYLDEISATQSSIFFQGQWVLPHAFVLTSGLSFNTQRCDFERFPVLVNVAKINISDKPVVPFSPRISLLKGIGKKSSFFVNFSNGFSSPTAQELVASVQNAPNFELLKAEKGLNKEVGFKHLNNGFWNTELVYFQQNIQNGLVRNLTASGNEYFLNTGEILQNGLEFSNNFNLVKASKPGFFKTAQIALNFVYNDFTYRKFSSGINDFAGKELPGVSKYNGLLKIDLEQKSGVFVNFDLNYLSKMPLNDVNTVYSPDAFISQVRAGYSRALGRFGLKIYGGIDNLLNEKYSAGYDFNAFGNRFFNPSPPRNFNGGLKLEFKL